MTKKEIKQLKAEIKADILRVNDGEFKNIEDKIEEVYSLLMKNAKAKTSILFIPTPDDEDNPDMVLYNKDEGSTTPFRQFPEYLVKFCIVHNIAVVDFTDAKKPLYKVKQIPLTDKKLLDKLIEDANPEVYNYKEN